MLSPEKIFASAQTTDALVKDAMKAVTIGTKGRKIKKTIAVDQLLLALLEHAVGDEGRRHTASVVLAAQGDGGKLVEAAQMWLENLLFPFKAAALHKGDGASEGDTPTSDDGRNATSFRRPVHGDTEVMHKLVEDRDDHNCSLSGQRKSGASTLPAIATSILPSVLHAFAEDENEAKKEELSAKSWDLIRRWGSIDLQDLTAGPANTFLLRIDLIHTFKHFTWWFQSTDEPHKYRIMTYMTNFAFSNKRVTFVNHSNSDIPLPDPKILRLHAALARVLFASGAGEYFDHVWRSATTLGVLKEDGTSDIGALLSALAL
ncbi:hypothetical protein FIBSPDRAFT_1041158 [Athelia psychrophila]|uniref:HNH nuclease domain-containing protein n=1 Tax=Athelia psychrophila TaxID=1759441 RepID=A0A166P790_9AGAM|nr:hypothetical protein FIBSPDRAFT_1041158 [Fibularhizoctonia sp. CBS 109695]